jgi:O-antigen biosynthesis protein
MLLKSLLNAVQFRPNRLSFPDAWVGHIPFANWLIKTMKPSVFVELGTHSGNSYLAFCQAVSEADLTTKCYAVDTWAGDEHAGYYDETVFQKLYNFHQEHFGEFSRLLQQTFDDASQIFADGSVDLLHIDGLHTYEAVKHDFETWLPKLAPHAVVLFHDTNVREHGFGVWRFWEELCAQYPFHFEFVHSHGLGVLQLSPGKGTFNLDWLQSNSPHRNMLLEFFAATGQHVGEQYQNQELKLSVREKEQALQILTAQLAERDAQLAERDAQLAERDAQLAERDTQLQEITDSKVWRVAMFLRNVRVFLLPPGSWRARLARKIFPILIFPIRMRRTYKNKKELRLIRNSSLFDSAWYLEQNSDVAASETEPLAHFIAAGWKEERNPSRLFHTKFYLDSNPDVKAAEINPLLHFILFGQSEGRKKNEYDEALPQPNSWQVVRDILRSFFRGLKSLFFIITIPRIKKAIAYLAKGDVAYLLRRFSELKQNFDNATLGRGELDLHYCADFFYSTKSEAPQHDIAMPEIDIIIPVFNGMEFLPRLFDAVFKNTNTPFQLIVVNDNSTDPAVYSFLEKLAHKHANMTLLVNQENLGFVKTINFATRHTNNHFVILNTDVEVPTGWLKRLMKPIINGATTASTTPFTNAGTICSFPIPLVDNPIFGNLNLDVIDSVFRQVDVSSISIELPTGVGFCMGINLEVWREIGPFDEERFGRGYGEENDWCMRASSAGYKNLMIPNLFVYHKHGGSFSSEEKQKLAQQNLQKVFNLHPNYQSFVEKFIKEDSPEPIRKFASLRLMGIASSKKPLLLIDHDIGGGANAYRKQLVANRQRDGQTVFLLVFDTCQRVIRLQASYQNYEESFSVSCADDLFILLEYLQIGEIFYNNLVSFDHPLAMVNIIRRMQEVSGAKLTIAIHDYYPLCPSYTLIDHTGHYCDLPSTKTCEVCLPRNSYRYQNDPHDILKWRQAWAGLLEIAEEIICFSESSAKLITRVYKLEQEHISIQPHKPLIKFSKKNKVDIHAPLSIGVVGALNYAKGAKMVEEVAKFFLETDPRVRITVIGTLHPASQSSNITITGKYDASQLSDILEQHEVNICFFPSVWPETFSYVTSELMELEMPLCVFNLGAPAERVGKYKLGHVIQKTDAQTAAREIKEHYDQLAILCKKYN